MSLHNNFRKHFSGILFHITRNISYKRLDYLGLIILLTVSLPIWFWFGNNNFIIFWDGWSPMSPLLQWTQNFNTIYLTQIGSGVYSFGYTSYSITLVPYTFLGILFGPMAAERLFYFLSFAFSGISMYYLIRDFPTGRKNELAAFIGAIYYMFNFYWMSGVFEDLFIPTVLTFLPLFFLLYRRYLNRIKIKRNVISPYLFLSVFSLVLIPNVFYQQSVTVFIFIFIYTLFSVWFIKGSGTKSSSQLLKLIGFFTFAVFTLVTYAYFLWPQFFFSNLIGNYSGSSSFAVSYLQALTGRATFFNIIRDIQPSSFFYAPFSYNMNIINFATDTPFYVALITLVPTAFAIASPVFAPKKYRRETLSFLLILMFVIFIQMGISGPLASLYLWLGIHFPLGTILEDPNITVGFLEPFLISILIGIGLTGLLDKLKKTTSIEKSGQNRSQEKIEKRKRKRIKLKINLKDKGAISYFVVALIIGSSVVTAVPIFNGSFLPSYNSLDYSYYGPTISSHVAISPGIEKVMGDLRNFVEGKRVLVLPLESGINMQTGNLSYVTSNSILQLETGADIISDNAYGFAQNSSYILSSINDLIYNTYYFLHGNYSMDQYFISTSNFSNFLTSFGIQYVLVVPGVPETPINSYFPLVTYNMSEFFLGIQKNVTEVYKNDGYILYENAQKVVVVSNKIDAINSSPSEYLVSDFASSVQWDSYNATNKITPTSFDKGFIYNYQTNMSSIFVLPASSLNVSTQDFSFMNIVGKTVNATVSFYYVYEFGKNYTFNGNWGTSWFPMTRYSQSYTSVSPSGSFQNLTFSTQIPFLTWLGTGNVSKIDWIEIAITPDSGLKLGDQFGFEIRNVFFSNYSSSLSAISFALSKSPHTDYVPLNSELTHLGNGNLTSSKNITYVQVSGSQYEYIISGSHGLLLLNLPVSYSAYWKYTVVSGSENLSSIYHVETNGYQNSYLINANGNVTIDVFFVPQKSIQSFAAISLLMITVESLYLLLSYRVRKNARDKRNSQSRL